MNRDLVWLIERSARLAGQYPSSDRLAELAHCPNDGSPIDNFNHAWRTAGLSGASSSLANPSQVDLPFVAWVADQGWLLVQARSADGHWKLLSANGIQHQTKDLAGFSCLALPHPSTSQDAHPLRALGLVTKGLMARKRPFLEAILATALINVLTLGISLYSMQVFDRVIPNQGFSTLTVLTVGVAMAIALEFMLKQIRCHVIDHTCNAIDSELSTWFFARLMSIRMDARPSQVGTLASQVKGFEMVRGVLASTSLFVLADVPFALFFITVIALIGGWAALVPLVLLPIALGTGLMFQSAIQKHTRQNLSGSNRKAGLLVEAVDGAESLKAQGGEWKLQSRWNRLVELTTEADREIRAYSALGQNTTAALQQFGYIGLIATGAWLVTQNLLTTGGLLACSIIANRAMMPIVQLPGVMVQWAHARAAIEGLDQLIALPNESDDACHALTPCILSSEVRLEQVRFAYGQGKPLVLEVPRLEISAGERIGIIGPIGSGKSTLLKLMSGLYRPNAGKVFVADIDAALLAQAALRETIGYVPQDIRLFSGTLRDNLLLGLPNPGDEVILDAARQSGLIHLISGQPKGLELEIGEGGRGVSGGQKQLIGLTRLLLAKPKIWLLDEPTGAMDSDNETRMVNVLNSSISATDTLIVATHKTALLPILTRLVIVREGKVVIDGPRDEVVARLSGKV